MLLEKPQIRKLFMNRFLMNLKELGPTSKLNCKFASFFPLILSLMLMVLTFKYVFVLLESRQS